MDLTGIDFNVLTHEPKVFVISGPSGIGKDTVVQLLKKRNHPFHFVVTVASRKPRPGEVEGKDYFFVTKEQFEQMISNDELAEYSHVYDTYKGVRKQQIQDALASGKDVLMRLDVQGAQKIRQQYPNAVLIFLIPTSTEEWHQRLINRQSESESDLMVRIEQARTEITYIPLFDYAVVNAHKRIDEAVDNIIAIAKAEHHKLSKQGFVIE